MTKHISHEWPDLDDEDLQMAYELKIPISAFDLSPSAFVRKEGKP